MTTPSKSGQRQARRQAEAARRQAEAEARRAEQARQEADEERQRQEQRQQNIQALSEQNVRTMDAQGGSENLAEVIPGGTAEAEGEETGTRRRRRPGAAGLASTLGITE